MSGRAAVWRGARAGRVSAQA